MERVHPAHPSRTSWATWMRSPIGWAALLAVCAVVALLSYAGSVRFSRTPQRRVSWPSSSRIDAALAAAQGRLAADPQDLSALVEVGVLHFARGAPNYPDAVNELEEARRLGALDSRIFYCLGVMYQELGLYTFSMQEYQRYLRNHPDDREVRLLAAKLYYRQGDFNSAIKEYERLRFHDPGDLLVAENLGLSFWQAKLADRAAECFSQLLAAGGPPARRAQFYLGRLAFESGRVQEGLDMMRRSLPADGEPEMGIPRQQMYRLLAQAYQRLGRVDEARDAWQLVLLAAANDPEATVELKAINRRAPSGNPRKR